jgi:glycosyltransferase involved in cell wall biosynthesis
MTRSEVIEAATSVKKQLPLILEGANSPNAGRPCRILHVAAVLNSGGVERWLVDLCEAGRANNLESDVAFIYGGDGLFGRKFRELGIKVFHCPKRSPLGFMRNLRRLLREHGPYDAIHVHLHAYSGFALIAAYLEGVPARVAHSHNVMGNKPLLRRSYLKLARALIRTFATAALAPSPEAMEDLLGRHWSRDRRWQIMRCGVDLEPFRSPLPAESFRSSFGIPEDSLVLGSVGRLTPEKNPEFLVDVLGQVLRSSRNAYLLLIGEGPLRERLECKATACVRMCRPCCARRSTYSCFHLRLHRAATRRLA